VVQHTQCMGTTRTASAFVTAADGFLGSRLVKLLVKSGYQVSGLTNSPAAATRIRDAGATAVLGDLVTQGSWQDEAAADWVFHLSPHASNRRRTRGPQTAAEADARVRMDGNLLDALGMGATRRIVYVADVTLYGAVGRRPITEDEPSRPSWFGRSFQPALERIDGYAFAGLPIVIALPGLIYGNGGWLRQLVVDPILAGRRVLQVGMTGPLLSSIHVHDCVRALVHVAERGASGGRYFVVNSEPARFNDFAGTFARIANRPLRAWRVPPAAARLVVGPDLAGYLHADAAFANIRLRRLGFRFDYPTLEDGLGSIAGAAS
jgi:nucleoside-diphosphate-sugar epimerase